MSVKGAALLLVGMLIGIGMQAVFAKGHSRVTISGGDLPSEIVINHAHLGHMIEELDAAIKGLKVGETTSLEVSFGEDEDRANAEVVANINGFDLKQPPVSGMTVKLPEEVVHD